MAFITDTRVGGFSIFSRFAAWQDARAVRRAQHATYVMTKKELSRLSSRELADIGLTAGDIDRVAMDAATR